MAKGAFLSGAAAALAARAAVPRVLAAKLRRDVARLNDGDYGPLLRGFADEAVLHFNDGEHRWAGTHVGKEQIERFLQEFVAAGLQGRVGRIWIAGPPWALELVVEFEDEAKAPDGTTIYANRTLLWARTRWGKIVEQRDYYEDTGRIVELERALTELGIAASPGR